MAKKKPPKRMFKSGERLSSYRADQSARGRMKRMAREHEDVLNAIETVLVRAYRADSEVHDQQAEAALIEAVRGTDPTDLRVADMVAGLRTARGRLDVPDDIWIEALRVVLNSVRTHSKVERVENAYLDFIDEYID